MTAPRTTPAPGEVAAAARAASTAALTGLVLALGDDGRVPLAWAIEHAPDGDLARAFAAAWAASGDAAALLWALAVTRDARLRPACEAATSASCDPADVTESPWAAWRWSDDVWFHALTLGDWDHAELRAFEHVGDHRPLVAARVRDVATTAPTLADLVRGATRAA